MSFELKSAITGRTYRSNLDIIEVWCTSSGLIPNIKCADLGGLPEGYAGCPVCGNRSACNTEYESFVGYERYYTGQHSPFQVDECEACHSRWFRAWARNYGLVKDAFYWANPIYEREMLDDII